MDLVIGGVYTIKNAFFKFVNDPYLMKNHNPGYRPYYCYYYDSITDLYWMIPFSSNTTKYEKYLKDINHKIRNYSNEEKEFYIKRRLGFEPIKLTKDSYLLYMDMFPISKDFINNVYNDKNKKHICFDSVKTATINIHADEVLKLLKEGFPFMSTLPNITRLEKIGIAYNNSKRL